MILRMYAKLELGVIYGGACFLEVFILVGSASFGIKKF